MDKSKEDILFKTLQNRLENHRSEDATEADWAAFSARFQQHQQKGAWVRWVLVGTAIILLLTLAWVMFEFKPTSSTNQHENTQTRVQEAPQTGPSVKEDQAVSQKESAVQPQGEIGAMPFVPTVPVRKVSTQIANAQQALREAAVAPKQVPQANAQPQDRKADVEGATSRLTEKVNPLNKESIQPVLNQIQEAHNTQDIERTTSYASNTQNPIEIAGVQYQTKGNTTHQIPALIPVLDSTKYTYKEPFVRGYFVEGGLLGMNRYTVAQPYPSDRFFSGGYIKGGVEIRKSWFLAGGFGVARMQETSLSYVNIQKEQKEIVSVDTSLAFSALTNRIMMNVDTLSKVITTETREERELSANYQLIDIPLQIQKQFGNNRHGLLVGVGVHSMILLERRSKLIQTGKDTYEIQKMNQNRFIIAPSAGVDVYQRLYKNMRITMGADYLWYAPAYQIPSNGIQIRAGLSLTF